MTDPDNKKEQVAYQESLKEYWDLKSAMDTYFKEGKEEGLIEGVEIGKMEGRMEEKAEIALNLLKKGIDRNMIMEVTGLSAEKIEQIKKENF